MRPPGWDPADRKAFFDAKEQARLKRVEAHQASMAADAQKRAAKILEPVKPAASRFTTQAAVDWGRSQGWKLIDREHYSHLLRRHKDVMFATDALFDDGGDGMVAVQGAGRYERGSHWQRFMESGGPETAKRRHVRVLYLEFERGNPDPVYREDWA